MRQGWKRLLCGLATALIWTGAAAEQAANQPGSAGRVVEPTIEEALSIEPRAEFYIEEEGKDYAVGYKDPTLEIHITEGRWEDTGWMAARIKIAYPAQLRTYMAGGRYGKAQTEYVRVYAKRNNAVLAINDDWFMNRGNVGSVVRQGVSYRALCRGNYDILGIDDQGDFHLFQKATNEDIANFEGKLVNTFTFGPGIVIDGVAQEVTVNNDMGAFHKAQRMGIGQIGPLEYICVCCEGPEDPGSKGLTIQQFGELVASFGDVRLFYNLDGGSSSTMAFKGKTRRGEGTFFAKINARNNPKERVAGGCIYFISAWQTEEETEE